MSTIANIILNDALGTPVAHTFAPARTMADKAWFEDRAVGIYNGYGKLYLGLTRPTGPSNVANRNIKINMRLETPVLEVVSNSTVSGISPAPTVAYRPWINVEACFPERCQVIDRRNLQKYWLQLASNAFITDVFEKYELPF